MAEDPHPPFFPGLLRGLIELLICERAVQYARLACLTAFQSERMVAMVTEALGGLVVTLLALRRLWEQQM